MRKIVKNSKAPFFITELAQVVGGKYSPFEPRRGTTRMEGEEGNTGGGLIE